MNQLFRLSGALLIAGCCSGGDSIAIVCDAALTLSFSTQPLGAYHVEARAVGNPFVYVVDCPDATKCGSVAFIRNFLPDTALVTVTYQGRVATRTVVPFYPPPYPPPSRCGTSCQSATATIDLP